jgi:hypothetical protein
VLKLILRQSHLWSSHSPLNLAMCMHLIKFQAFTVVCWKTIHILNVRFSDSNLHTHFWGHDTLLCWCFGGCSLHFENVQLLCEQNYVTDIKQYKFPYSVNAVYRGSLYNHRHHHWYNPFIITFHLNSQKCDFYKVTLLFTCFCYIKLELCFISWNSFKIFIWLN